MTTNKQLIQIAMARACMNNKEIAKKSNLPESTVLNVLSGKSVTPKTVGKIAKALGVDVTEIIRKDD